MRGIAGLITSILMIFSFCSIAAAATQPAKQFDQWQVECRPNDKGVKVCALFFLLVDSKSKSPVFAWSITKDDKTGANKMVIRTLTGIVVAEGISVIFQGAKPVAIPYRICMPAFCVAEIPLTDAWLKAFKANKQVAVVIKGANGKEGKYDIGLSKFAEAFDYYTAQSQAQ